MKKQKGLLNYALFLLVLILFAMLVFGVPAQLRPASIIYNSAQSNAKCECSASGQIECSYSANVNLQTGDFYAIWFEEPLLRDLPCATGVFPAFVPDGTAAIHNGEPVAWRNRGDGGLEVTPINPFLPLREGTRFITGNIVFFVAGEPEPIEPPIEPPVEPPVVQPGPTGNIISDVGGLISNIFRAINNFFLTLFGGVPV